MNLIELLKFLPLIIGAFLAYHLIFKLQLPSKSIIAILTYFIGIVIVFLAVSWLITTFLADWANDLLTAGTSGAEWTQFIDASENVVDDAFTMPDETTTQVQPQPIEVVATPTPRGDAQAGEGESGTESLPESGPTSYTVVAGDTLNSIARKFGVTVADLRVANGIPSNSDLIIVGQKLTIPARPASP